MPVRDPLYHPLFVDRRAAMEVSLFDPFPPSGRRAWRRPDGSRRDLEFHVRHYDIALDVDFERRELRGTATLTIESLRDGLREAALDAAELRIESVRAGSRRLAHAVEGHTLRVTLPRALDAGKRATLRIAYATRPRKGLYFTGPTESEPKRTPGAWTQGQADDSHWWIPCVESTESRATLETRITVPAGYRVIGNGRLAARRKGRGGRVTWHWSQETAHPVYLASLVIGKYVELRDRAGRVPLLGYVPRGREREGRRFFRKTGAMIARYEEVFGHPYPYPKYAQSCVADFTYGGMENTSATTMFDGALRLPEDSFEGSYDGLVAHELAHQWWGDLVTCRHWTEGWLNEGFATYSEIVWLEKDEGPDAADYARLEQMVAYQIEDGRDYRRPIVETRYKYPSQVFDRHLYEKGAIVLHMLRALLGDAAWRRSLKRYVTRHAFGPVETSDLRRACEEETGRNLAWFFDQWIHAAGHPELRVTRRYDDRSRVLTLTIEQTHEAAEGTPEVYRIPMDVEIAAGGRTRRIPIELRSRRETIQIPLEGRPRYVAIDPAHHVMKLLEFERTDEELRYGLARSAHVIERIRCARELAAGGDAATVAALLRAMRGDRFWGVRAAAAVSLGEIGMRVPGLSERIASAASRQGTRVRRAAIWALGRIGDDAARKRLRRLAGQEPDSYAAGVALIGIARAGGPGAFETIEAQLERESHREMLQVLAFEAMAQLKDSRAVDVLLDSTNLRYRNERRAGAARALGRLGIRNERVESRLVELLSDPWFRVRTTAAAALVKLKSPRAAVEIARALDREVLDFTRSALEESLADAKGTAAS
ncbi:MAG TPA: M1 family aminopeptidase [Acidobacteriota bacterium]|nr:M1 family aminopeptidase [Acidobacteriota bacterium]